MSKKPALWKLDMTCPTYFRHFRTNGMSDYQDVGQLRRPRKFSSTREPFKQVRFFS